MGVATRHPDLVRELNRMVQRLDFKRLKYFAGIVDAASISTAASLLGVAQPALSKALRTLEDDLGVQLLERTARGVQPTPAGRLFYEHCRVLTSQLERACVDLARCNGGANVVRIGVPFSVGMVLVAPLLQIAANLMPGVEVQITERHTPDLKQAMLENKLDLAMVSSLDRFPELHYEPIIREGLFLAASVRDTAGSSLVSPLTLEQVSKLPLLFSRPSIHLRRLIDHIFANEGIELQDIREIDMFATLLNYVDAGLGYSILPAGWIHREVKSERIRALAFADARAVSRVISLCRLKTVTPAPAVMAVWRLVRIAADRTIASGDWMSASLIDAA